MKKILMITITGIILISCVFIQSLAATANLPAAAEAEATKAETQPVASYVLKSEQGRLVVYRKGEAAPCMTTDTYTAALPKADKHRLEQGVEVQGDARLRKTLEDYCS